LTSIKSRINTYLHSDFLPTLGDPLGHTTLPQTKAHKDSLATDMKSQVNLKLSDLNINGALHILSGNSYLVDTSKE